MQEQATVERGWPPAGGPGPAPSEIVAPRLALRRCTVDEHARALVEARTLPFWWYQGTSRLFGNYSIPLRDGDGSWWYQVKPGLCWPVDFLRPIPISHATPPYRSSFVGFQHVVAAGDRADSHLVVNALAGLDAYGAARIPSARRKSIRRGLRDCEVALLADYDRETFGECRSAWNDLWGRSGWKRPLGQAEFDAAWRAMLELPGMSIIVGRERRSGAVAGFRITKIIGDTAYTDTTASRTEMLHTNVNSAVMYAFLANAARLPGVTMASSAIKSYVASLEDFKTSFGFEHRRFPARTTLRPGVAPALRLLFRSRYDRLVGNI